jgi:hypothetical protein
MNTQAVTDDATLRESNLALAHRLMTTLGQPRWWDMMDKDIVVEFPYAPSLGESASHVGKEAVMQYLKAMFARLTTFKFENVKITAATEPSVFFCEYEVNTKTSRGEPYHQVYINKLRFNDGKLVSLREFWNPKWIIDATGDGRTTN